MRIENGYFCAAIFLLGLCSAPLTHAEQDASDLDGRALYVRYQCWQCHGYEGQGGAAPRVATMQFPFEAFVRFVRYPNEMPAYAQELLSDDELRRIFKFLTSIPAPPEVDAIPALRE